MTLRSQILEVLEDGPAVVEQIVDQIGSTPECVAVTLGQLRQLGLAASKPVRREGKRPRNLWMLGESDPSDIREEIPCMTCNQMFRTEDRKTNRICRPCKADIRPCDAVFVEYETRR